MPVILIRGDNHTQDMLFLLVRGDNHTQDMLFSSVTINCFIYFGYNQLLTKQQKRCL
jgi:hypothetical protein